MKLKYLLVAGMAVTLGIGLVSARTWTSTDGSKKFEGELKTYDKEAGKVTVIMRNGRSLTFDITKLSDGDKTYLDENGNAVAKALKAQKIGSKLGKEGILEKIDGNKFAAYELTKAPEFYVVYFSASWGGPCQASAPQLVKQYEENVADNPIVELIHVSLDRDEKAAEAWAAKESFPWPTVTMANMKQSGLEAYSPRGIPNYKLIDKDGKVVAEGKGAVFQKVKELKTTEA